MKKFKRVSHKDRGWYRASIFLNGKSKRIFESLHPEICAFMQDIFLLKEGLENKGLNFSFSKTIFNSHIKKVSKLDDESLAFKVMTKLGIKKEEVLFSIFKFKSELEAYRNNYKGEKQ